MLGADITDYFNYGFNEVTWRAYCAQQKMMRESKKVRLRSRHIRQISQTMVVI